MDPSHPIGILAVQGDFEAHSKVLDRLGAPWRLVKKPADLEGLSGLILPGGESTTFLKILQEEGLWEPLRQFAGDQPVFGTCAGAILLAEEVENPPQPSLGLLRVAMRRNGYGRQLSSSVRSIELHQEFQSDPGKGSRLEAVLIRAPVILRTGPEVQILARLDRQPVLVRQGLLLAATFHPELTSDDRIHRYFCEIVAKDVPCKNSPATAG